MCMYPFLKIARTNISNSPTVLGILLILSQAGTGPFIPVVGKFAERAITFTTGSKMSGDFSGNINQ